MSFSSANRLCDIANLSNALNFPVQFHHTQTFFSERQKKVFKENFFLRRTKEEVDIKLPPMLVSDQRVQFDSPLSSTLTDYTSAVLTLEKLAPKLSHYMGLAKRRVPGAYAKMTQLQIQYQSCIMSLRVISAAPISWPFSKVLLSARAVQSSLSYFARIFFETNIANVKNFGCDETELLPTGDDDDDDQVEIIRIDSRDDDVDIYEKLQQLEQLDQDRDFIVDDTDNIYGAEFDKAEKILGRKHQFLDFDNDDEKKPSEEWKKAGRKRSDDEQSPLEDVIVDIELLREAIMSLESILDEKGVLMLSEIFPTFGGWVNILADIAALNTRFNDNAPHELPLVSHERKDFLKELNTIWQIFQKQHKKLLQSATQQRILAEIKHDLVKRDPKMMETLRLVKNHLNAVEDSEKTVENSSDCSNTKVASSSPQFPGFHVLSTVCNDMPASSSMPVVVSSCFLRCLYIFRKLLEDAGISFGIMEGCMSVEERKAVLQDFENGSISVLLLSQYCGAEGITLTSSCRLILTDVGLSPSMASQVMARVHRLGQTREVHVTKLCAESSIEDFLIHDLLPQKNQVIQDKFMASNLNDNTDGQHGLDNDIALNLVEVVDGNVEEIITAPQVESIAAGVSRYWQLGPCAHLIKSDEKKDLAAEKENLLNAPPHVGADKHLLGADNVPAKRKVPTLSPTDAPCRDILTQIELNSLDWTHTGHTEKKPKILPPKAHNDVLTINAPHSLTAGGERTESIKSSRQHVPVMTFDLCSDSDESDDNS